MTPTIFAIGLCTTVAVALLYSLYLMAREERYAKREYWLKMKQLETEAIMKYGPLFADAKELSIESPKDGHLKIKMSRRDHAPLPPQYIRPTIITPQALYGGGATRLEVISGTVDEYYARDCDWKTKEGRKKVKNYADEPSKQANTTH
jgi:hypothetical protein